MEDVASLIPPTADRTAHMSKYILRPHKYLAKSQRTTNIVNT